MSNTHSKITKTNSGSFISMFNVLNTFVICYFFSALNEVIANWEFDNEMEGEEDADNDSGVARQRLW